MSSFLVRVRVRVRVRVCVHASGAALVGINVSRRRCSAPDANACTVRNLSPHAARSAYLSSFLLVMPPPHGRGH